MIIKKLLLLILFIFVFSNPMAYDIWENFETHKWLPEGYGGESPDLSFDSTRFPGKIVLQVAFSGTGAYGFLRTDLLPIENWSSVTAVIADVYFEDSTTGNDPTSKFEAKDTTNTSYEFLVQYLTKNSWQTVTWPLRSQSSTANYSNVSWVLFNVESFLGYSAMTAYFDNIKLLFNDGRMETWDILNEYHKNWLYGGSYDTGQFAPGVLPFELISHIHTSDESPAGAGYLSWIWDTSKPTYAEIAAVGLHGDSGEDWSAYSTFRYDVYTSNTTARYKIFLWDGSSGFAPISQWVTEPNTWTRMQFDISSDAVLSQNPSFNRLTITEVKCVVEYLDVPGAESGEAWFDNLILSGVPATHVEKWLYLE